jgi:hypothetical protein
MQFINSWASKSKQGGKYAIKVRLGRFTLFDFYLDIPRRQVGLILFNFGVKNERSKQ